jgi:hypothetical protein
MRRGSLAGLLELIARMLEERGALAIYGGPGTLRTRLALLACSRFSPCLYVGAGRHARLEVLPAWVTARRVLSFYDELLEVVKATGLVKRGAVRSIVVDELLANLVPYRASLSESVVARMLLTEIELLREFAERGGKAIVVCGEDPRTGGPLALRYLRRLRPRLLRTSVSESVLTVEERDLADPLTVLWRTEVDAGEVERACARSLSS